MSSAMSLLGDGVGASLEVRNESRNLCCFHPVAGGGDGIFDEGEFALDLGELVSEVAAVVIIAAIVLNFCNGIPVVKVGYCLV